MNESCDTVSTEVGAWGLSPSNSESILPNSNCSLPDKVIFQFTVYYYEPYQISLKPPDAVDVTMLLSTLANTRDNQPITILKPQLLSNTTVTCEKVKFCTRRMLLLPKFMRCKRNDLTTTLRFQLSVGCRFHHYAIFVISWPAWVVYGFTIATKWSKPHSHQSLLPGRSHVEALKGKCPQNFVIPRKVCFKHTIKTTILQDMYFAPKPWNLATRLGEGCRRSPNIEPFNKLCHDREESQIPDSTKL